MFEGARVAVVVPAYNEGRLITRALGGIPAFVDAIYVVDDGSEDDTAAIAEGIDDARVRVLRQVRNQGVGASIEAGYRRAFGEEADVVAVMAGDAQMDPHDLARVIAPVVRGEAVYAKGDRLSFEGVRRLMPAARYVGNHVLSFVTRLATGLPVRDSQCGYTALGKRGAGVVLSARLWPRYGYPNDLLGRLAIEEAPIVDVVVRPIYADERSGIGLRHAVFVVPYVLARVFCRRVMMALVPKQRDAATAPSSVSESALGDT